MATNKSGINFSQQLETVSPKFNPVLDKSEGIRAEAKLSNIASTMEFAGQAIKGAVKYGVTKSLEQEIDDTIENYESPTSSLSDVEEEQGQNVVNSLNVPLTTYKLALDQGRMTPFEFNSRVSSQTKAAIDRTPLFTKELVNVAEKTLSSKNMVERLKFDTAGYEKQIKAQEKDREWVLQTQKDLGIALPTFSNGTIDYDKLKQTVIIKTNEMAARNAAEQGLKDKKFVKEEDLRKLKDLKLPTQISNGTVSKFVSDSLVIIDNDSIKDKVLAIEELSERSVAGLRNSFAYYKGDKEIDDEITSATTRINALSLSMGKAGKGDNLKERMVNKYATLEAFQKYELANRVNLSEFKHAMDVADQAAKLKLIGNSPALTKLIGEMYDYSFLTIERLKKEAFIPSDKSKSIPAISLEVSGTAVADSLKSSLLSGEANKYYNDELKLFEQNLSKHTAAVGLENLTSRDLLQINDNMFESLAKKQIKGAFTDVNPQIKGKIMESITTYNRIISDNFLSLKKELETSGKTISLHSFSDGTLYVEGADDNKYNTDINNKFIKRINNSMKVYANFLGKNTDEISDDFLKTNFKVFADKPFEGVPNESKTISVNPNVNSSTIPGGGTNKKASSLSNLIPRVISVSNAEEVTNVVDKLIPIVSLVESNGVHIDPKTNKLLKSKAGAEGVTGLMPGTQIDPGFGIKPLQNRSEKEFIRLSHDYLTELIKEFGGDVEKGVAAYNFGLGNLKYTISKHGNNWKENIPTETQNYIHKVLD